MKTETYDIVIVGTGAAGLFAALSLPEKCKILMVTKEKVCDSDSYLAQGGICVLKSESDFDSYFEDTMRAGRYENNKESVSIMINESREVIDQLIKYGVEFERDEEGNLRFTREGAHSTYRILYHQDITGREITSKLINQAQGRKNITIKEQTTMIDLLAKDNICHGILAEHSDGTNELYYAKTVILATGGIGGLFIHSTNFRHIRGDSFAIALRHKITLENLNYIQIHPTTLYSKKEGRRFLISESVRGEGAILLNEAGERFVNELLPRDVVTEAIRNEMEKYHMPYVYLSLEKMEEEEIKCRFPHIYQTCLEEGIDITKEPIPVTPAQHYLMGGIKVNTYGETSMKNLYAVGETACNGVHGANRLASNSLLESLVFARRAADVIESRLHNLVLEEIFPSLQLLSKSKEERGMENKKIIMNEIKRMDEDFYVKWCDNEN